MICRINIYTKDGHIVKSRRPDQVTSPLTRRPNPAFEHARYSSFEKKGIITLSTEKGDGTPAQEDQSNDKANLMQKIKSYGLAGTLSYVVTELAFWAIALPGAWIGECIETCMVACMATDLLLSFPSPHGMASACIHGQPTHFLWLINRVTLKAYGESRTLADCISFIVTLCSIQFLRPTGIHF